MDAVFKLTSPESAQMTLTLTGSVEVWRKLLTEIRASPQKGGGSLDAFGRQVADMIEFANKPLVRKTWTTGWATGEVEEAATGEREAVPS